MYFGECSNCGVLLSSLECGQSACDACIEEYEREREEEFLNQLILDGFALETVMIQFVDTTLSDKSEKH